MKLSLPLLFVSLSVLLISCSTSKKTSGEKNTTSSNNSSGTKPASNRKKTFTQPLNIDREEFVSFAKTLLGSRYKYASAVPANGLDCSGFIYYVFGHFNVKAPRSSVDFTNEGETIDAKDAEPGDIILFTGSDNSSGIVGHMGIITENGPGLKFIHSASGKSVGVIINALTGYYKTHFVKVIRILK
jgi:cell wall-associated NlpC family hydrolase